MKILSFYWGFCSSASLFINDEVVAAANEERFTRIKMDDSFPKNSIGYCLSEAKILPAELDGVAIAGLKQGFDYTLIRTALWDIDDYLREQKEYWYPKFYEQKDITRLDVFRNKADLDSFPSEYWKKNYSLTDRNERFHKDREDIVAQFLNIDNNKVKRMGHHRCHAAYSYYASSFRSENILAFTMDGWGDGLNATIGIFDEKGNYTRLYQTSECNIGRIYRYLTLILGMKPNEHEYKVMGLAPYGKEKYAQKALEIFRGTLYVDGIDFKWKIKPTDSYFWFKEKFEGIRFDHIAYALQAWIEELLTEWVKNAIKKFGIRKIIFSGGVGMNIKAMGKIAQLPEVKDMFVGPSPSDESMAISAGICLAEDLAKEKGEDWNSAGIKPLYHMYLGPAPSDGKVQEAVYTLDKIKYKILTNPTNKDIALLLLQGKVLARCVGRMEFGQRALGNRSILADPINLEVKDRINEMIKCRDFWMPFAPVIIDKYASRYLANPNNIDSPYMTLGFNTSDEGYSAMRAACHPADRTARPQVIRKEQNPDFYGILEEFEKITGRGALLNTSFNLHGHPIVNTPKDALEVFENSGLEGLILNKFLILKNENNTLCTSTT